MKGRDEMAYVLAYDIGTTGVKTCIFSLEDKITLIADANEGYGLYIGENGEAEQDCDEWWQAMCQTTKKALGKAGLTGEDIAGISFCSQMQGIVLVDENGKALRRPMSYMDQRAKQEVRDGICGGIEIAGGNLFKTLKSLRINRAVASSVKDPVWKYKWVQNHEPEIFDKVKYWLDVKDYLVGRCTGNLVMTEDSAFATLIYDTRHGHEGWSDALCRMYKVDKKHLAPIIKTTDKAGELTEKAAQELGLAAGTPVFGGGGDASLIGVGAGSVNVGDTHIYCGTSGWVSTVVDRQVVDVNAMIASVVGAVSGNYNYFAEMETAGKCLEWVRDHLALDEIDVYLEKKDVVGHSQERVYTSLYDYLTETMRKVEAGCGGVIFTPWLHGNRCPFEDPNSAGMFFNIKLETGKAQMIRAVVEGVCYHLRWMLECQSSKVKTSDDIRFVGGGALSDVTCQILADVTGRRVETVSKPQNVGAVGAAAVIGVGLGVIDDMSRVRDFIEITHTYEPNPANKAVYDRNYSAFRKLYAANKKSFEILNS